MRLEAAGGRSAISKQAPVTLIAERALLRRSRTSEPTLTAERWFLSVCYRKAPLHFTRQFGVTRRTIRRDIDYLRDQLNAPIEFDGMGNGYYNTEPTSRLPFPQLTQGEMLALYLSERMMRQFRGTPFEPDLRQAIAKLSDLLPDGVSVRVEAIADFLSVLPGVEADYDPETFSTVMRAVIGRRRLKMVYWTASRNVTTSRVFDPYELSLVDDGWYAFGHYHLRVDIRIFAIQRVQTLHETGETFDRPAGFRVEDYLRGSFRAFRGGNDHHVVLRFKPEVARRFAEKKWHASQLLEPQPDGSLIARLHLNNLVEIKRWVMWWGGGLRGRRTRRAARSDRGGAESAVFDALSAN